VVQRALEISSEICIYTNSEIVVHELGVDAGETV